MRKSAHQTLEANRRAGYWFMLPGFIFMLVYMAYPLLYSLILSFSDYNFLYDKKPVFLGLKNYVSLFSDRYFKVALRNTAVFSLGFFPSLMVLSLIIALLLDYSIRTSKFFRTCIFLPMIVPLSLSGVIFQWILNENYGLVNWFLTNVLHTSWAQNWLGDKNWAMVSIIVVSLWKNMGMLVIMFMAGLQSISDEIIEASRIDGANTLQRIFRIIIPNLGESFIICGIWAVIQSVKVFEQPYVMTNGGPGTATMTLYQYTYIQAFKYMEVGYASAISYFMGIIILVLSFINMYINRDDASKEAAELKRAERRARRRAQRFGEG